MRKLLIIGKDIHANRYRDVLLFRDDIEISFNLLESDLNQFDYIIFSEPYCFNSKWCNILKDYKKVLLLEKCQFRLNLIKRLKCNVYFIHLREFDNNEVNILDENKVIWPNLSKERMSKIYHTLPNVLDFLCNIFEKVKKIEIKDCTKYNSSIKLQISINNIKFDIIIQDVEEFGAVPKINDNYIQWPNYFECINKLIDKVKNYEIDFEESYRREKKYKLLIRKVENIVMDLFKLEYSYNKNIIYKKSEQMLMAYNQENGDMYEFNEVGAEIFLLISQEKKLPDIFDELSDKYNITIDEIYADVEELINRLIDLKIIIKK